MIETLHQDSVFYDVGAGVGYFTVFASEVCTDGEIHSFELDSKLTEAIEASLQKNGTSANILLKAVSDESGNIVNFTEEIVPNITDSQQTQKSVKTVALDDYCKSNCTPDVIKIDVEGFEYYILQGAQEILAHLY